MVYEVPDQTVINCLLATNGRSMVIEIIESQKRNRLLKLEIAAR